MLVARLRFLRQTWGNRGSRPPRTPRLGSGHLHEQQCGQAVCGFPPPDPGKSSRTRATAPPAHEPLLHPTVVRGAMEADAGSRGESSSTSAGGWVGLPLQAEAWADGTSNLGKIRGSRPPKIEDHRAYPSRSLRAAWTYDGLPDQPAPEAFSDQFRPRRQATHTSRTASMGTTRWILSAAQGRHGICRVPCLAADVAI